MKLVSAVDILFSIGLDHNVVFQCVATAAPSHAIVRSEVLLLYLRQVVWQSLAPKGGFLTETFELVEDVLIN